MDLENYKQTLPTASIQIAIPVKLKSQQRNGYSFGSLFFFCPDVPSLPKNPVFLYYSDDFQKPNPFRPDIVVAINDVFDQKLDALIAFESQFTEGGGSGHEGLLQERGVVGVQ